jgi:hypothetical protein
MTKPTAEEILSLFDDPLAAAMIDGVIETPHGDVLYEGPRLRCSTSPTGSTCRTARHGGLSARWKSVGWCRSPASWTRQTITVG